MVLSETDSAWRLTAVLREKIPARAKKMDDNNKRRTIPPKHIPQSTAIYHGTRAIWVWFHENGDVLKSNATYKLLSRIY